MSEKVLSCFIDEAGDFGNYESHSPFYVVSVVIHDQSDSIQSDIDGLNNYLKSIGYQGHTIHTGPLIRRESVYENMLMEDRKKIFNLLFRFVRKLPVKYFSASVRKSECKDSDMLEARLTKAIKAEVIKNDSFWRSFDKIVIYYDNGQKPIKRIFNVMFNSLFSNVEIRKISPSDYRLFQVADLICTMEHISKKIEIGQFSNTEADFFSSRHDFKRDYMRKLEQQRM